MSLIRCVCHGKPVEVLPDGSFACRENPLEIVIVESPYRGATPEDGTRNRAYLNAILRQLVLVEGLAPFASHQLYTSALDDGKPEERAAGIQAGFAFRRLASRTLVYTDLGISSEMQAGIEHAQELGQAMEFRTLPGWGE